MIIHAHKETLDGIYAITESASSGYQWGKPVMLRIVKIEPALFAGGLKGKQLSRTKGITVLKGFKVDARYNGPRSTYGMSMASLVTKFSRIGEQPATESATVSIA
jgi:hypothetical protein